MKPEIFIEDSVELCKNDYFERMLKTKEIFFKSLRDNKSIQEFEVEFDKIWKNLNYKFMNNRVHELEKIIDDINKASPDNTDKLFFEMIKKSKFEEKVAEYKKIIMNYYRIRSEVISKGISNVDEYLMTFIDKYDSYQTSIPYKNKDGTIHSWHSLDVYNSMLFNTNLQRCAINRTMIDADYLDMDLLYVPAHNLACPLCQQWQGRVYSKSGKDKRYPKIDEAYKNGLGHPNCRHNPVIFWDKSQLQENRYDSEEDIEEYKIDQKKKAIRREITKQESNLNIAKEINNQTLIDKMQNRIKTLNSRLSEL